MRPKEFGLITVVFLVWTVLLLSVAESQQNYSVSGVFLGMERHKIEQSLGYGFVGDDADEFGRAVSYNSNRKSRKVTVWYGTSGNNAVKVDGCQLEAGSEVLLKTGDSVALMKETLGEPTWVEFELVAPVYRYEREHITIHAGHVVKIGQSGTLIRTIRLEQVAWGYENRSLQKP